MTEFNLDKIMKDIQHRDIPLPFLDFQIFGVLFSFYKKLEFGINLLETFPYRADGEIPCIFLDILYLNSSIHFW